MITPYLEQLIWEGKAAPRTWATGGSGSFRIPVRKNRFIIITDITWHPFVTQSLSDVSGLQALWRHYMLHSLLLYTSHQEHLINYREWFTTTVGVTAPIPLAAAVPTPGQPLRTNHYLIFDENVRGNILMNDNAPEAWTNLDYTPMPVTSDELNRVYGVQNADAGAGASPVLRNFRFGNAFSATPAAIQPAGEVLTPPAATTAFTFYQFQQMNGMQLGNPTIYGTASHSMLFPLVNFDYVEVFMPLPQHMKK